MKNQVVRNVQMKRGYQVPAWRIDTNRPFMECIVMAMEQDPYLKEFFDVLQMQVQRVRRSKGIDYEREERKLSEIVDRFAEKKAELVDKMKRSGITMVENCLGPVYTQYGFNGELTRKKYDYALSFNGLFLEEKMLKDPNDRTYQDKYEQALRENEALRKEAADIKKKLSNPKVLLIGKENVKALRSRLRSIQFYLTFEGTAKKQLDTFNALTDTQKELIVQYLETVKAIDQAVTAINDTQKEYAKAIPPKTDLGVMDEALDRMVADGMNEEDLMNMFQRIDRIVENRAAGKYDSKRAVKTSGMEIIATFINDVYGASPKTIYAEQKTITSKTKDEREHE